MIDHIRDTYLLFCGQGNREVKEYLYMKYYDKRKNLPSIHFHLKGRLSDKLSRINRVIKRVFDPYNIYEPVKEESDINIDFTNDEINSVIKKSRLK